MSYDYNDYNDQNRTNESAGSGQGGAGGDCGYNNAGNEGPENVNQITEENSAQDTADAAPAQAPEQDSGDSQPQKPQVLWSDPAYESASAEKKDEIYTPGRYAYGAQNSHEAPEKEKKPRKRHGFLKAVCLVLVCALVSGAACYGVVDYMMDDSSSNSNQVVLGSAQPSTTGNSDGDSDSPAQSTGHTGSQMAPQDIYDMACEQAVGVNTEFTTTNIFGMTATNAVSGSGFIISTDGYILTNFHVISYAVRNNGDLTVLMHDGTSYPAQIIGYVEDNDVAVIKIDATGLNPVTLGDSSAMEVGDAVYAVGNPLGELTYTMTDGIVSALDRVITTQDETTGDTQSINMFQISAAVNSGNSGGPVYNAYGEVIGIVTAKYGDSGVEGLGFAIPINDAVSLATQLIEQGYVSGAALGVQVQDVSVVYSNFALQYYNYPQGVCIMEVNPGSAAEAAGILQGDIITGVDGETVESLDEMRLVLRRYSPGDEAVITVFRTGQTLGEGEYIDLDVVFEETAAQTTEDTQTQQNQPQQGGR